MKKLISLGSVAVALMMTFCAMSSAQAADTKPMGSQQSKMKTCNMDASGKKGDDRKAFMKDCLSAKPAAAAAPQSKMTTCNVDSKGMKGDERKKFMSSCLKKG